MPAKPPPIHSIYVVQTQNSPTTAMLSNFLKKQFQGLQPSGRSNMLMRVVILFNNVKACDLKCEQEGNGTNCIIPNSVKSILPYPSLISLRHFRRRKKKTGVPVSKTVTLVADTADGGTVCNEGLSLEH